MGPEKAALRSVGTDQLFLIIVTFPVGEEVFGSFNLAKVIIIIII